MPVNTVAMLTAGGLAPCLSSAVAGLIERYTKVAPDAPIIAYKNGAPVRVTDVANVVDGVENAQLAGWANDARAIIMNVQRQPGANVIEVADRIKKLLPQLQASLPQGVEVKILSDRTETVRDFVTMAFKAAGFQLEWRGQAEGETAVDAASGKTLVRVNPKFYRPAEVDLLIGDATKAQKKLGWKPKCSFKELVHLMVIEDMKLEGLNPEKFIKRS